MIVNALNGLLLKVLTNKKNHFYIKCIEALKLLKLTRRLDSQFLTLVMIAFILPSILIFWKNFKKVIATIFAKQFVQ